MKKIALLLLFVSSSYCGAQDDPQASKILRDAFDREVAYRERERKAIEAGSKIFGVDERLTETTEKEFRGTLYEMKPPDFRVDDWGYTKSIFRVIDIVDDKNLLVMPVYKGSSALLIRGLDTKAATTGAEFILQHPVSIDETYTYKTVDGGEATVLVLDVTKVDARLVKQAEEAKGKKKSSKSRGKKK